MSSAYYCYGTEDSNSHISRTTDPIHNGGHHQKNWNGNINAGLVRPPWDGHTICTFVRLFLISVALHARIKKTVIAKYYYYHQIYLKDTLASRNNMQVYRRGVYMQKKTTKE